MTTYTRLQAVLDFLPDYWEKSCGMFHFVVQFFKKWDCFLWRTILQFLFTYCFVELDSSVHASDICILTKKMF